MPARRRERALATAAAHDRLAELTSSRPWVPLVPWAGEGSPPPKPPPPVAEPAADPPPARPARPAARLALVAAAWRDRLPPAVRAAAAGPGLQRGHAVVLGLVAAAGVVGALLLWQAARPEVEVVPPRPEVVVAGTPAAEQPTEPAASPGPTPAGEVVVHVAGAVRRPGVVVLPAGSRVVDAIEAAGGARPGTDLTSVNLARPLLDGEQVAVGVDPADAAAAPGGGSTAAGGAASGEAVVDLNTATLDQLDALPGVGPVLAQRILDWREENGRFSAVDELGEVSGIGDARLADLRERVRV